MNIKHIKPDNFYHVFFKNVGLRRSKCVGSTAKTVRFWCMNGSAYIRNEDGSPKVFTVKADKVKKFKSSTVKRSNEYAVELNGNTIIEGTSFQSGLASFKANKEITEAGDSLELIKTKQASGKVCEITVREFSPVIEEIADEIDELNENENENAETEVNTETEA